MLQHKVGNLIDMAEQGEFDIIVHGCNCFQVMGSGIAKEIRSRYPDAYQQDLNYGIAGDVNKLGNYTASVNGKFTIINAYTQYGTNSGMNFQDLFEYESFTLILRKLSYNHPKKRYGFPYIGMGLAGGNKTRIIKMLENFAVDITSKGGTVTLVEFG